MFIKLLTIGVFFIAGFFIGWFSRFYSFRNPEITVAESLSEVLDKPLEKYSIESLSKTDIKSGKITIKDIIKEDEKFNSYQFGFEFNPNLDEKTKRMTTGQINIPRLQVSEPDHHFPTVLMFRGYVNQDGYNTGDGTRRAAQYFAENGFATIAPDFLGYSGSDKEASNIFETRFQTYTTAIALLKTIENQNLPLITNNQFCEDCDNLKIGNLFIWGHSNGGQIAITLLEATGKPYPTTLWAPVTKPFPYSVLYYTDDSEDGGKLIRKELAKFEELYDTDKFSLNNYLDKINAPIQLQQGTTDDAVPVSWSEDFVVTLKEKGKQVKLLTYPSTDHNMRPMWDEVAENDLKFFEPYIK